MRERIVAGDSDDRVIAYVRARYGDFVLLRPPFEIGTLLLWGGPMLILLLGEGTEVEVKLPGRFKVSPQIAGAIKAVPGVVAVEAV